MQERDADIIVVGAGPAGLHAALKAAILNHEVLVLDKGRRFSRVSQAPAIANVPGRPGISGLQLLEDGRRDLARFRSLSGKSLVRLEEDVEALALAPDEGGWKLRVRRAEAEWVVRAPVVILATGIVDRKPGIGAFDERGHETMAPYVHRESIGYCLLCEGWALAGHDVAVIGRSTSAAQIATDVGAHFEARVALLTDGEPPERAPDGPVRVDRRPIRALRESGGKLEVTFEEGPPARFDKALLGLGWHRVNSGLAQMVGARTTREGYVVTDASCEVRASDGSTLRGLFAIGDVRAGPWKQVPLAWADAELAVIAAYARRLPTRRELDEPTDAARTP
jgi:thioredoxin reductase (NADPH)